MRILSIGSMYPPHHLGGAELIWRSATRHQRRAGHTVRVLTSDLRLARTDPHIPEDEDVHRELRWYWRDHRFPRLGPLERLRIERHGLRVLERHLEQLRPDVVAWWSMGGMSMSLLERVRGRGLPAVGVLLDDWLAYGPQVDGWQRLCRRLGPLARPLAHLTGIPAGVELSGAAEWVFMSATVRRRAVEAGLDVGGSRIAYRGIDPDGFAPGPVREWGGRLIYVGRIDPRKGIPTAVRALGEEALAGATLTVVGGGDPEHLRELRELADELGLAARTSFLQVPRGEVAGLIARADALLFPVLWEEPWGLVPLEAMASGTPVVATGRGGSGEYLRDGHNCLLFEPAEDSRALAAKVAELAADPGLRARLRAGGLETASRFAVESFNAAVLEALEEAAR